MGDSTLFILHHPSESQSAEDVKAALIDKMKTLLGSGHEPEIELRADFVKVPNAHEQGPFSLVLVLLPPDGKSFSEDEKAALRTFLEKHGTSDVRLVPIALDAMRHAHPVPLQHLKSFALHNLNDPSLIESLTTRLLNLMYLRVSSDRRKLFLSYRFFDGKEFAQRVEKLLKHLGYEVWRDESLSRDMITAIAPGSSAQEVIRDNILNHGFVLVLDTMAAPESTWVHEEIDIAISYMLPILPVVVEEVAPRASTDDAQPLKKGGRFKALAEAQHEVRVSVNARLGWDRAAIERAIDRDDWGDATLTGFYLDLESKIRDRLLANLRARRQLIDETRQRLTQLTFDNWSVLSSEYLLFSAERNLDQGQNPGLQFRLLIQCAPYESLLDRIVDNLCQHYREHPGPYQYAILIHQTVAPVPEKRRLLNDRGGHVLLLRPDQLVSLPTLVSLA